MDLETTTFVVLSGIGLLALSIGAFGVLDAYHGRHPHVRRVDLLIGLYVAGVLANVVAYLLLDRWYISAAVVFMVLPADRAMRIRAQLRQRRAELKVLDRSESE